MPGIIRQCFSRALQASLFAILVLLGGCATPIEIKTASSAQLDLIDTVDQAIADLQAALHSMQRNDENLLLEEGQLLIARQAIAVATPIPKGQINADALFAKYKKAVRPWIDYALVSIETLQLQKKIDASTDPLVRGALQNRMDDLKILQAKLDNKPADVQITESIIKQDLAQNREAAAQITRRLDILRAQVALMRSMHTRIDTWLATDITVTEDQVNTLQKAYTAARQRMKTEEQ